MTCDDITLAVLVVAVAVAAAPGLGRSEQALRVETAAAIRELQPRVSEVRADELARVIDEAAARHDIDPLLVVAVVMRESSFRPDVERLERTGAAGEIGLMQIHPRNHAALALRPEGCPESLEGARCQIGAGTAWLAAVRAQCGGSTWRWLGSYGASRCLSEEAAGMAVHTRRAWAYCERIGCEW